VVVKFKDFDQQIMQDLINFLEIDSDASEIPVACAIYDKNSNLITKTKNLKEGLNDPTAHAEILSIREAGVVLNNWNLEELSLYVTLEPCLMCAGAILESKISKLVFGAFNQNSYSYSAVEIIRAGNKKIEVVSGVLENECSKILSTWFANHRRINE
jgi:tRNA(adenine34) deaminase